MAIRKDILNTLIDLFKTQGWTSSETPELTLNLVDDLGLDSFDFVNLVLELNRGFDLQIPSQEVGPVHFETLGTLLNYLEDKLSNVSEA